MAGGAGQPALRARGAISTRMRIARFIGLNGINMVLKKWRIS